MATKTIRIGAEVEREVDMEFGEWAENEGRSKTRHLSILVRKLVGLAKQKPAALAELGLLDKDAHN